jgi:phosphoserine phosphatase
MRRSRIPVNAIDLDGTLLPYDSMHRYWRWQLRNIRTAPSAAALAVLRLTGGMGRARFTEMLVRVGRRLTGYDERMRGFAAGLYRDLDGSAIRLVQQHSPTGTVNVLCTASPEDYVRHLAARLGWEFLCSRFSSDGSAFTHVYGEVKAREFARRFPASQYEYNFAIADSDADRALLRLFKHSLQIGKSKPVPG